MADGSPRHRNQTFAAQANIGAWEGHVDTKGMNALPGLDSAGHGMAPFLRPERTTRAVYEAGVTDIEVSVLLQCYLRGFRKRGGELRTGEPVTALKNTNATWTITTVESIYQAKTVVNAAEAWAGEVGALAGASSIGLVAKRHTAMPASSPGRQTDGFAR